jgi:two-component system osmolarity sensor histidine kinase EnvZ
MEITAHHDGGQVMFEIADRGPGLPEHQIDQVLRPFTRLDTARSQANGAGLGLTIVDRVVQRHRGRLEIKNREGGGLAVRIWLATA